MISELFFASPQKYRERFMHVDPKNSIKICEKTYCTWLYQLLRAVNTLHLLKIIHKKISIE